MLKLIGPVLAALKAGQELRDPASWKKGQNLINACAAIIAALVAVVRYHWPEVMVSDEQILEWAGIGAAILAAVNGYLTTATSQKIGV